MILFDYILEHWAVIRLDVDIQTISKHWIIKNGQKGRISSLVDPVENIYFIIWSLISPLVICFPLWTNEAIKLNLKWKSKIFNGINLAVVSITQITHCYIVLVLQIMQSNVYTGWQTWNFARAREHCSRKNYVRLWKDFWNS